MKQQLTAGNILSVPVKTQAERISVLFRWGQGKCMKLELSPCPAAEADFTADYPVPFAGETVEIESSPAFFMNLQWKQEISPLPDPAEEPERPYFHYTAARGWLNDPNGLYYKDGVWHLFHQYNPFAAAWGNMHWFHATSRDLLHWKHDRIVLHPDETGAMFSGCAVIDRENRSGLQAVPGKPPILLYYTAAGDLAPEKRPATQNLAFSVDDGRTFHKYSGNPLLTESRETGERDPAIVFDPEENCWRMALFLSENPKEFALYRSDDLLHWTETDRYELGEGRECPGLFRIQDEADKRWKWVFFEANGFYRVGTIKHGRIHFETDVRSFFPKGTEPGCYAGQLVHNAPDGRIIYLAWLQLHHATRYYAHCMTLPVEFRLSNSTLLVFPFAIPERKESCTGAEAMEIELHTTAPVAVLKIGLNTLTFDFVSHELRMEKRCYALPPQMKQLTGRLIIDVVSAEFFEKEGLFYFAVPLASPAAGTVTAEGMEIAVYSL